MVTQKLDRVAVEAAQAVRDLYCMFYRQRTQYKNYGDRPLPRWDGGLDPATGKTYKKSVWVDVATTLAEIGADPLEYIQFQFNASEGARPPYPNMLVSPAALTSWGNTRGLALSRMRMQLAAEFNAVELQARPLQCNLHWSRAQAVRYAVVDKYCAASALVKLVVAHENGVYDVDGRFIEDAVSQYAFQAKLYDQLLAGRIPECVTTESAGLRKALAR